VVLLLFMRSPVAVRLAVAAVFDEGIILLPQFRIGEYFVGFLDFHILRFVVIDIEVRMMFLTELIKSFLNFRQRRCSLDI
jgi:hypothetical protein